MLVPVPKNATFESDDDESKWTQLAEQYSFLKSIVAVCQTLYALSTLYKTRGGQIEQFGYAAYGLTVIPYGFMSIVNLVSNIFSSEYSAIFVVETEGLRRLRERIEAQGKSRDYFVEDTVGKLKEGPQFEEQTEEQTGEMRQRSRGSRGSLFPGFLKRADTIASLQHKRDRDLELRYWPALLLITLSIATYLGILGGLTGFDRGHSTYTQRVWIMLWFAFSVFMGLGWFAVTIEEYFHNDSRSLRDYLSKFGSQELRLVVSGLVYVTPAIGGFVVVGQMIQQYGICEKI